jgi:ABC-type multidrug transport system ATPase subunit
MSEETAAAPGSGELAVRARGLRRDFADAPVLRDVSFALPRGSTLVVLGPNGAGKSTLLRIVATLLRASAGELEVLGARVPKDAWRARGRIGYLAHSPLLYRDLTVAEALDFHARLHGVADPGARRGELLRAVGMEGRDGQLVRTLSAGQLQRLAVCRCLVHDPELLLLDEPAAHLDPHALATVAPLLGPASDRTRIVVTHDVEGGLAEADRALVLSADGRPAYEGPADGISAEEARAVYAGAPG